MSWGRSRDFEKEAEKGRYISVTMLKENFKFQMV